MHRILKIALCSLLSNIIFSAFYILLGVLTHSWWLFTVGIYYAVLGIVRFGVLQSKKKDIFLMKFTGVMLLLMSAPLVGTVILAVLQDRGMRLHQIIMIAMAAYAFAKITLAIVNLVKVKKSNLSKHIALRNISLADACVSIFALQRSMLVSFGAMPQTKARIFNSVVGLAVCCIVFLLGLNLVRKAKHSPPKEK